MTILYTENEFLNASSTTLLKLQCNTCNKEFYIKKQLISHELFHNNGRYKYCSYKCTGIARRKKITCYCTQCNKEFVRQLSQLSKNNFCSCSCATTFNNQHKTQGTRRSKLEIWIEQQLKSLYPNLEILFNNKQVINSELDIYIPSLKLAFELNGLFHYEPIFGQDKLDKIVNNDNRKFAACNENNISLCIIDTSAQKHFTEKASLKFLNVIINIINEKI